jgi:hypothetical protein
MYGVTMSVDGSMELFNISDTMVDGIIKDINYYDEKAIVRKTNKDISILKENEETIYYYRNADRKEKVLQFINVH